MIVYLNCHGQVLLIMSPDKELQLFQQFPLLYDPINNPLCRHIDCEDGWFQLITSLSKKINDICLYNKIPATEHPKAIQVKEKFGGLRFYVGNIPSFLFQEINTVIQEFEQLSLQTCEICGASGKIRQLSWVRTLCDQHAQKDINQ